MSKSPVETLLAALALAALACSHASSPGDGSSAKTRVEATRPAPSIPMPKPDATQPADLVGLHNVVAYDDGLLSGSVPEGEGFATLEKMGIRTIISVDGMSPDVEAAKAHGLRYVHLPISYGGIEPERKLEIARAVKDLPGPIYIHCHHGKHRSAAAAGAAVVTLGYSTPAEAESRMKVSGTSPSYTGLFACVASATIATDAQLAAASAEFPEVHKTSDFVSAMVEIDEVNDHLKAVEKAGWSAPADHPDLVPSAEAGLLADLLRTAHDDDEAKSKDALFKKMLDESNALATALEAELVKGAPAVDLSAHMKKVQQSCKDCHAKYRD